MIRIFRTIRTMRTALRAVRKNPMRAILTILGIIIGVAAVIAMMEIGNGSSTAIQKTISSMGANIVLIFPGVSSTGGAIGTNSPKARHTQYLYPCAVKSTILGLF